MMSMEFDDVVGVGNVRGLVAGGDDVGEVAGGSFQGPAHFWLRSSEPGYPLLARDPAEIDRG